MEDGSLKVETEKFNQTAETGYQHRSTISRNDRKNSIESISLPRVYNGEAIENIITKN